MIKNLKIKYDEICAKIDRLIKFKNLYEKYFCFKRINKDSGVEEIIFNPKNVIENAEFLQL